MVRFIRNGIVILQISICAQSFSWGNELFFVDDSIKTKIIGGDTVYCSEVPPVFINAPRENTDVNELLKYQRLVRNVKKAYPFAIIARDKLKEVNETLMKLNSKKEQKQYVDSVEHRLKIQYEAELRDLTVTQGRILIKLIDREIGNTSYNLVKEYRGSFSAFFWQSLARLFGSNLKSKYYPNGEDKDIEEIILKIQSGQI
jgi:hypothetical protein